MLSKRIGMVFLAILFLASVNTAKAGVVVDGSGEYEAYETIDAPVIVDAGELPCDGTRHDLATANFVGVLSGGGAGAGRAIGFQADSNFTISSVGIMADLVRKSFDVVIYDSPDGHSAGAQLHIVSVGTGGTGYGWNDIAINFNFSAGSFYVINFRPTDGISGQWANSIEYYHDDGLPFSVGPLTILEGMEGFDAENDASNVFHPHLRICVGDCPVSTYDQGTGILHIPLLDAGGMGCYTVDLQKGAGWNFNMIGATPIPCP